MNHSKVYKNQVITKLLIVLGLSSDEHIFQAKRNCKSGIQWRTEISNELALTGEQESWYYCNRH